MGAVHNSKRCDYFLRADGISFQSLSRTFMRSQHPFIENFLRALAFVGIQWFYGLKTFSFRVLSSQQFLDLGIRLRECLSL
jgi:hypothetical protein